MGELVYLDLPKQEIIPGPIQVEALINQDQTISKDLTLWNQQGSQVLRSQILTLPIDQTLLICGADLHPGVAGAHAATEEDCAGGGNTLVYADTYEQALAELGGDPEGSTGSAQ